MDSIFRNNKSKKSTKFYTKNTFMGIQTNIKMMTSKKNGSPMIGMDILLLGMSRKVIKIRFHNMFNVMKSI